MPARLRYLCCGSMLLLAACARQQTAPAPATGDASWAMKAPAASQRYRLATGDTATGADLAGSVTPVYPAALLSTCPPPQEVQALVIVGKAGRVSGIRIADDAQAGEQRRPFILATRKAVMQWRFNPLQMQHDGLDAAGNPVVISETRPFSLTYLFRFACHGGKATVTSNKATGGRS
jgi:hypothetical protein